MIIQVGRFHRALGGPLSKIRRFSIDDSCKDAARSGENSKGTRGAPLHAFGVLDPEWLESRSLVSAQIKLWHASVTKHIAETSLQGSTMTYGYVGELLLMTDGLHNKPYKYPYP